MSPGSGEEWWIEIEVPRLLCVRAKRLGIPYTVTVLPRGVFPYNTKVTSDAVLLELGRYATGRVANLAVGAEALGYGETKSFAILVRRIRAGLEEARDLLVARIGALGGKTPASVFRPRRWPARIRPIYREIATLVRLGAAFLELRNEIPNLETVPSRDLGIFLYAFLWPRVFPRSPPPSPVSKEGLVPE